MSMNTKHTFVRWGIAATLSISSLAASATTCDSALSSYDGYIQSGLIQSAQQLISNHPECFGASSQTSTEAINVTSFIQISAISSALSSRFLLSPPGQLASAGKTGMAAAAPGKALNVWGNLSNNNTELRYTSITGNRVANDSDALTTTIGADYGLTPNMVVGASLALDRTTGDGRNSGSTDINHRVMKGYSIAPYIGYSISKQLAFDASLGWGQGELSQSGGITADVERWFLGANLNYSTWMGNTQLSGRASYLHGEEKYDKAKTPTIAGVLGSDAKNTIDQVRVGGQAAWWMNGVMPYVGLAYTSDVHRSTTLAGATNPIGRDAWVWSVGANFMSLSSGVIGGVVYEQETSRSNQDNYRLIANIGLRF